jgi:hypothetical protein
MHRERQDMISLARVLVLGSSGSIRLHIVLIWTHPSHESAASSIIHHEKISQKSKKVSALKYISVSVNKKIEKVMNNK